MDKIDEVQTRYDELHKQWLEQQDQLGRAQDEIIRLRNQVIIGPTSSWIHLIVPMFKGDEITYMIDDFISYLQRRAKKINLSV